MTFKAGCSSPLPTGCCSHTSALQLRVSNMLSLGWAVKHVTLCYDFSGSHNITRLSNQVIFAVLKTLNHYSSELEIWGYPGNNMSTYATDSCPTEKELSYILVKYSKLRTGFYSYADLFLCPLNNINKSIKIIIYQNQIDNMRYTMVSSQALSISDTTRFRVEKKNK